MELARGCPAAAEDDRFRQAMADAGARWHVFHVVWRLPEALQKERPRGPTSLRQQVVAWMEAFAALSEECGLYAALGASARELAGRLRVLWSRDSCELPYYPAFRAGSFRAGGRRRYPTPL